MRRAHLITSAVVIISLCLGFLYFSLSTVRGLCDEQARVLGRAAEVGGALELYHEQQGQYPPGNNLRLGDGGTKCLDSTGFHDSCSDKTYITNFSRAFNVYTSADNGTSYLFKTYIPESKFKKCTSAGKWYICVPTGCELLDAPR